MRIDDFLSTVGLIKRRTEAKRLGDSGMIEVNGRTVKPSYDVKTNDIIVVKGKASLAAEVREIPRGSVPKAERDKYFRILTGRN